MSKELALAVGGKRTAWLLAILAAFSVFAIVATQWRNAEAGKISSPDPPQDSVSMTETISPTVLEGAFEVIIGMIDDVFAFDALSPNVKAATYEADSPSTSPSSQTWHTTSGILTEIIEPSTNAQTSTLTSVTQADVLVSRPNGHFRGLSAADFSQLTRAVMLGDSQEVVETGGVLEPYDRTIEISQLFGVDPSSSLGTVLVATSIVSQLSGGESYLPALLRPSLVGSIFEENPFPNNTLA